MGGGMVYGEPYSHGFSRYPYGANRTAGYNSGFAPRRLPSFWGDESSYPDEVVNLARKRKLDGVKGEPLGTSNGTNVREIFVEDPSSPSAHRNSRTQDAANGGIRACSPPASPSRCGMEGGGHSERTATTVAIPVVFTSAAPKQQQSVPIVSPEGSKKPRRTLSEHAAAVLIQSLFRGYSVRRTQPLQHMRKISGIRSKLREITERISDTSFVQRMRTDMTARLHITEGLMALLLQLDSIQGVHSDVRAWRKAATKEVVTLQDKVDALLNGREGAEVEHVLPELPIQSVKEDTVMTPEESDDDVMTESGESEMPPVSPSLKADSVEEIVLDQLKLEDEEAECQTDEKVTPPVTCGYAEEIIDFASSDSCKRASLSEPAKEDEFRREAEEGEGGILAEDKDRAEQNSSGGANVLEDGEASECEIVNSTRQPMNANSQVFSEALARRRDDDETRRESFVSSSMDLMRDVSDRWTDATDHTASQEARDSSTVVEAVGEQIMEVDREEEVQPQTHTVEFKENDFSFKSCPGAQEKIKNFLKEISCPEETTSPLNHQSGRSNAAEEMDCQGAPFSPDLEENDGSTTHPLPSFMKRNDPPNSTSTESAGSTRPVEHYPMLLKLSEENKMLRALLLDVMKWNQLQANSMKDVMERLGKLEDKLIVKQKKSCSKLKHHRCTRSRLERRLRR
ncbi:hypothetical protein Mapa_000643 [Marchantia paleacea]|nr:hypothetical protein Mapa_000643 [Marchantia paleacea]